MPNAKTDTSPSRVSRQAPAQGEVRGTGSAPTPATALTSALATAGNTVVREAMTGTSLGDFGGVVRRSVAAASRDAAAGAEHAWRSNAVMGDRVAGAFDEAPVHLALAHRKTGGQALPEVHLQRLEVAFEHDFSHVRIHDDARAAQAAEALNAAAFAVGADIFFGAGRFAPGTTEGDRLLAHELTHVVQHDEGRLPASGPGLSVSNPSDPAEVEARGNEDRILAVLPPASEVAADARAELDAVASSLGADLFDAPAEQTSEDADTESLSRSELDTGPALPEAEVVDDLLTALVEQPDEESAWLPLAAALDEQQWHALLEDSATMERLEGAGVDVSLLRDIGKGEVDPIERGLAAGLDLNDFDSPSPEAAPPGWVFAPVVEQIAG